MPLPVSRRFTKIQRSWTAIKWRRKAGGDHAKMGKKSEELRRSTGYTCEHSHQKDDQFQLFKQFQSQRARSPNKSATMQLIRPSVNHVWIMNTLRWIMRDSNWNPQAVESELLFVRYAVWSPSTEPGFQRLLLKELFPSYCKCHAKIKRQPVVEFMHDIWKNYLSDLTSFEGLRSNYYRKDVEGESLCSFITSRSFF